MTKENNLNTNKYDLDIAYYAKDGRLTAEPNGKKYRLGAVMRKVKELGRPLTDEEMSQYEIKE